MYKCISFFAVINRRMGGVALVIPLHTGMYSLILPQGQEKSVVKVLTVIIVTVTIVLHVSYKSKTPGG